MAGTTGAAGPSPIGVESSLKQTYQLAGVQETLVLPGTKQVDQEIAKKAGTPNIAENPLAFRSPGTGAKPNNQAASSKKDE